MRRKRESIVREHMDSENRHEFDATLATFEHPRYELVATGDVYDGTAEVERYFAETRRAFPDQRNELLALHHADDAVLGIARDPLSIGGRLETLVGHPLTIGRGLLRRVIGR